MSRPQKNPGSRYLALKLDFSRARSAAILWCYGKPRDVRMFGEQFRNGSTQRAGAVAVDYPHFAEAVQEGFVEKLVGEFDGLVGFLPD